MKVCASLCFFLSGILLSSPNPVINPVECSTPGHLLYNYRLFDPGGATATDPLPLVLFLHGLGERESAELARSETKNTLQVRAHISGLIRKTQGDGSNAPEYPAFLLAPQNNKEWFSSEIVEQIVEKVCQSHAVDRRRVYVTGLSAGGRGTWEMLGDSAGVYAAGVPLSAVKSFNSIPDIANANTPVWAFHGDSDDTVSVRDTRLMITNANSGLIALGATPRYTERPGWGHSNWNSIYSESPGWTNLYQGGDPDNTEPLLYEWLFSQTLPAPRTLLPEESLLIDFGTQFTMMSRRLDRTRYWNNALLSIRDNAEPPVITDTPALPQQMRTASGIATICALAQTKAFSSSSGLGVTDATLYPLNVQKDYWQMGTFAGQPGVLDHPAEITLSGLIPGAPYRIRCFASRQGDDGGRGYVTRYRIDDVFQDLNTSENIENVAEFAAVHASSLGKLVIEVGVSPANPTGRFAQLSALEVTALTPAPGSYAAWLLENDTEPSNPALLSDSDGDSYASLLEYLLGGQLALADTPTQNHVVDESGFSFDTSAIANQGVLCVEGSHTLDEWTEVGSINLATGELENLSPVSSPDPQKTRFRYLSQTTGNGGFSFFRVKATL